MGCFQLQDTAALSGCLAEQGFTEKGNKQLEKQEAEKPCLGILTPISREVCQAIPKALSASESRPLHKRGQGRLGELLARQLPQEHSPLLVPPGVARVMGSRGREYARLCIRVRFPRMGCRPLAQSKRDFWVVPPVWEPQNCPGDIFVGCNSCQVSVASLTSLAKTLLKLSCF